MYGLLYFVEVPTIKEGDLIKLIGSTVDVPTEKAMRGHVVDVLGVPIDGRGAQSDHKQRHVKVAYGEY